jgi:hypothetical protein
MRQGSLAFPVLPDFPVIIYLPETKKNTIFAHFKNKV